LATEVTENTEKNKIKSVDAKDAKYKRKDAKKAMEWNLAWTYATGPESDIFAAPSHRIHPSTFFAFLCDLCVLCG
jgi:hypothetical protein